jgi:hypothetical protein
LRRLINVARAIGSQGWQGAVTRGRSAASTSSRSARDIFGDPAGVVDPRHRLGERREHRAEVHFLESFPVAVGASDVADEQDHRGRILEGGVDADRCVGRARAAGDEGDARPPRHLAVRLGHVGDSAFLPADDDLDGGRVVERVERCQVAFARNAEDAVAALRDEVVDQDAAAGAQIRHGAALSRGLASVEGLARSGAATGSCCA